MFKATHKIVVNDSSCGHFYELGEMVRKLDFNGTDYEENEDGNVYENKDGMQQFVEHFCVEEVK